MLGPSGELYSTASETDNQETITDPQGNSIVTGTDGWHDTVGRVIPGSYNPPGTSIGSNSSWPRGLLPVPRVGLWLYRPRPLPMSITDLVSDSPEAVHYGLAVTKNGLENLLLVLVRSKV